MTLVFALLFIVLHLLSLGELFPSLAPYRILLILAAITAVFSIPSFLQSWVFSKLRLQIFLIVAFFAWVCGSWVFRGWFGGVVPTAINMAPSLLAYFVAIL